MGCSCRSSHSRRFKSRPRYQCRVTCFIKYLRDNLSGRLAVNSNQPTIVGRHGNHAEGAQRGCGANPVPWANIAGYAY